MRTFAILRLTIAVLLSIPLLAHSQSASDLTAQDKALLEEVQHLTAKLGPVLWPDWKDFPPFLIRNGSMEYLIGHPSPPGDFRPLDSETLARRIWTRSTSDTSEIQASYPLNGVMTAMMSSPAANQDMNVWVLKAAHETFHCYQGSGRIRNPFIGKFAGYNDLTFPFPYHDANVKAPLRLEAEFVFRLATVDANDKTSLIVESRLLPLAAQVERALYTDAEFDDYKVLTEWSEGVARYTETELAKLAGTPGRYEPAAAFTQMFPAASYATALRQQYGPGSTINAVRFVGERVRGRVMFYFLGMGKAFALDRMNPGWRISYKNMTLDQLLEQAATQLSK